MAGAADIIASGSMPAVQGDADLRVLEVFNMEASGAISAVQGDADVVVYSGGDRAPYTVDRDARAAGIISLAEGPGLFVVGGCCKSNRVVLIDPTAFRRIRVAYASVDLGLPVVAMQTTENHVFAYLHDTSTAQREMVVLSNTIDLDVVARFTIADGDQSAWVAVDEDADVFAYPSHLGEIQVRKASGDFDLLAVTRSVAGETDSAVWFRYAVDEHPETADVVERIYYLYVAWKSGAKASVIRYRKYRDSATPRSIDDIRWWGETDLPHAEDLRSFHNQANSVFSGASVTNRGTIVPKFDGAVEVSPGRWLTFWGWDSDNVTVADIPPATSGITRNRFIGSGLLPTAQGLLPRLFIPGRNTGVVVLFTSGQEVKWEIRGHPGGGVAVTDYSKAPDSDSLLSFSGFLSKGKPPSVYRYEAPDPLSLAVEQVVRLGRVKFNNAGYTIDLQTLWVNSDLPNDSIEGNTHWWPRDIASRLEGGVIQGHSDEARVSRVLVPEWDREMARGILFNVPEFNIASEPINFAPDAIAQTGERMGWEIGHSADASVVCLSAESYANPAYPYTNQGRVFVWLRNSDGSYTNTDVIEATDTGDPLWTPDEDNEYFSRYTEVTPSGDKVFVGSKRGPGIAVFAIDADGKATYERTLTWPAYTAKAKGQRAHEARFDVTGKFHFMTTSGFFDGDSDELGEFNVLYSDDNWRTFQVLQAGQRRPGAVPGQIDNFSTIDVSRDGTTFVIGAWEINRLYVFRSDDGWQTYSSYELTNPPGVTAFDTAPTPGDEGVTLGISNGCSYDGFRVVSAANEQTWDYENGVPLTNDGANETGTVWWWEYDVESDDYLGPFQVLPPVDIPTPSGDTKFGGPIRMNSPGFRFVCSINEVVASGTVDAVYLYGIHDGNVRKIAELTDGFVFRSADTRWAWDRDLFIVANKAEDNPVSGKTEVGGFRTIVFSEAP
jgi:hypothetical protein